MINPASLQAEDAAQPPDGQEATEGTPLAEAQSEQKLQASYHGTISAEEDTCLRPLVAVTTATQAITDKVPLTLSPTRGSPFLCFLNRVECAAWEMRTNLCSDTESETKASRACCATWSLRACIAGPGLPGTT